MASVWAARLHGSRGFRKLVAIKTILQGGMDNARLEQMFLEEATLASQIHHPNVVQTLELGEHEGTLFLVMEWVDGESLSQLVKQAADRGGFPLTVAVNLIGQACRGLHAAHDVRDERDHPIGLVHRDISPQNVLVTFQGVAKLVDFGIAKATQRSSGHTENGEVKGKLGYMAPEQVKGQPVDRRTDLFALGALLYLVTTGRNPFKGQSAAETLQSIASAEPPARPSTLVEGYPLELEQVVMKALEKSPAKRFSTAFEMLQALAQAMPSCFDVSRDAEVAAFVQQVLGERGVDRRKRIALAGDLLDRARADGSPSSELGSQSSLSAIAIDRPPASAPQPSVQFTPSPSGNMPVPPARTKRKVALVAAASLGFVLFGVAVGSVLNRPPAGPATAAAGGAPLSASTQPPALPPAPVHSAPEPAKTVIDIDTAPEKSATGDTRDHRKRGPGARRAPAAVAPVAPRAPASNATSPPSPSSAPKRAWDPNAFGGRH
jgi:serine/threonine-protein kinase